MSPPHQATDSLSRSISNAGYIGAASSRPAQSVWDRIRPYIAIARPDHWPKNVFMLLGVALALFYHAELLSWNQLLPVLWGVLATCIIASSNYVLNEILDAPSDRNHPTKKFRPVPSGQVSLPLAYAEWLGLGICGLAIAATINAAFFWTAFTLLVMGLVYNVPPLRTKELPYVDVLSESVNNPLRLMLGWFVVSAHAFPPVSLLIAYWMIGAFFMAAKRLAEYRGIADAAVARTYRSSFGYYTEERLLLSTIFYVTCFALFLGVFIIRYHLELILTFPLIAGFIAYYMKIALKPNSAAQAPERLHRERGLMVYLSVCLISFVGLMFVRIPLLYELFNVTPSPVPPLWQL